MKWSFSNNGNDILTSDKTKKLNWFIYKVIPDRHGLLSEEVEYTINNVYT